MERLQGRIGVGTASPLPLADRPRPRPLLEPLGGIAPASGVLLLKSCVMLPGVAGEWWPS